MEQNQIPLLNIPSIDSLLQLKIMTVDEIIKKHEKFSSPRTYNENLQTAMMTGIFRGSDWTNSIMLNYDN